MAKELKIGGYYSMYYMNKHYKAKPIGKKQVRVKGTLRRKPDRMDLVAYIKINKDQYLAVSTTYKGNLYGPYRVPNHNEFQANIVDAYSGDTIVVENKLELEPETITAVKARFAEYLEWRLSRFSKVDRNSSTDVTSVTDLYTL